ncbi:hypothetical protein BURKHO8Y_60040 [Burkholderia sp. 8Y]|nr:hypothetical protein BURKHO8Y_60040 [Burkholderia sp. 8Y]
MIVLFNSSIGARWRHPQHAEQPDSGEARLASWGAAGTEARRTDAGPRDHLHGSMAQAESLGMLALGVENETLGKWAAAA